MGRVMLIGLPKYDSKRVVSYFQKVGVACDSMPTIDALIEKFPAEPPALIIAERPDKIESLQGLQAVLKTNAPATPTLVLLPEKKAALAQEAMSAGAYECLSKPIDRFHVLAAAKRATKVNGRTLFGAKVKENKIPWATITLFVLLSAALTKGTLSRWNGAPANTLNLASATLSGIEWDDRSLWAGNWYDSTITHYVVRKGLTVKSRSLLSDEIFKMQDSQPILMCNTPDSLVTVGFDLKLRSHQRAVGLPTLQTTDAPGTNPTGLAWDGENVWSVDGQSGFLFKHGADLRPLDSLKSIISEPNGLAWDGTGFWVMGGKPLRIAKLEKRGSSYVWRGPYRLNNFLAPDVPPTGMAVGFERLWVVTGGTPHMISRPLKEILSQLDEWK